MKFLSMSILPILFAFGIMTTTNNTETITKEISSSSIIWKAQKVTGAHEGTVDLKSGDLSFDADGNLTGGSFMIDMNTIAVTDLTGDMAGKLKGHLMSDDFFAVASNPTAELKITNVAPKGTPGDYKVTADLTIKGKTAPVKFYTNISDVEGMQKATSTITIDRTVYDVRYGSSSFFSGLGDKTIYDEFTIEVELLVK
jgi:polyisoprenoid-binding protein YceI